MQDNHPVRIQRSRKKGFNLKEYSKSLNGLDCVYVGRGTRWGNPFRIVQFSDGKWGLKTDGSERCNEILVKHGKPVYETREDAAIDSVRCYDMWLLPYTHKDGSMMDFYHSMANLDDAIMSLKGKNLSCWCPEEHTCHADLLIKIANSKK